MSTLLQWAIGVGLTAIALMGGGIVVMLRVAFKLGHTAREIESVAKDVTSVKANADQVPVIVNRLGTLENAWNTTRSDIKELRKVVFRSSQPDYEDGE